MKTTDNPCPLPAGVGSSHKRADVPQILLNVGEVADLLRTTRKAIYAMVERRQLPGVTRLGRRVLIRADVLLDWLRQKSAPSLRE